MAIKTADWVVVETTTSGKGNISLGPAVQGYTSFTASFGESTDVYYSIISGNGNRECGVGVFNKSSNTLTRSNVMTTIVNGVLLRDKQPISLSGKSTIACTINSSTIDDIIAAIGSGGGGGGGNVQQPTISVGIVQTGQPNTLAVVENSGDNINAVFDFVIPRGADGAPGTGGSGSSGKYLGLASTATVLTPPFYAGDFYATSTPGTYANFGGLVVGSELAFFRYTGTAWVKDTVYVAQGVARTGITLGKVTSGWIHIKSITTTSGVTTFVYEVGANTTIEFTSSSSTSLYSTSTIVLNANNNGTSVEYTQTTSTALGTGRAAIAIDLATNLPILMSGAVSTSERICLISYQVSSDVTTQRSIFPSNHFFSFNGTQQRPDITQTNFSVVDYGASTFNDATDNSSSLFYAKWAAQVVNRALKKLTTSDSDLTPPKIEIVFPNGTFVADFSTTKYKPSANDGPYSAGYWTDFRGMRLIGTGIDKTIIKHSGGELISGIYHAENLTLYRIRPATAISANTAQDEVRFYQVKFYFAAEDTNKDWYLTNYGTVKRIYFQKCVFDFSGPIYAGVWVNNYDEIVVEDCKFNPTGLGFAQHNIGISYPNAKNSKYIVRGNQFKRGITGIFTRMMRGIRPFVGIMIEDNDFEDVVEEAIGIDGIGDSTDAPVLGCGLITSVNQPAVCPGEKQWLMWRNIAANSVGAWATPVTLTDAPTTTAYAFRASPTQPAAPTGTALVPNDWTSTVPFSNDPIWMSTAPITGGLAGSWTAPVVITETRIFRYSTSQPTTPTSKTSIGSWAKNAPASLTNVWMSKAYGVNGLLCGVNNVWSTPVNISGTPAEANWTEYRIATGYSANPPSEILNTTTKYSPWRTSPMIHNTVIGADLYRVNSTGATPISVPVSSRSDWQNYFFTLDDDSGREGTVAAIAYADPVTNVFVLDMEIPVSSIKLNGWCGVHSGLFDSVIRGNRFERCTTGMSIFMNVFGNLIEGNHVTNTRQALRLTGQLSMSFNRARAHNNIVRSNTFIGMEEETNSGIDPDLIFVDIHNDFANDPDHRSFNNQFIGNTVIGGRIRLGFQGNLGWSDNTLIDVDIIDRIYCRRDLPDASSVHAGQVTTRILDDRDVMSAHVIPFASMVLNSIYLVYKYGTTDWKSITISGSYPTGLVPAINQGFTYTSSTPSGTGKVMPLSFPASSMVAGGTYSINSVGTTDWTALGAANNTAGTEFTYNGFVPTSWGTGEARPRLRGIPASITYHACKLVNGVYSWVEV